MISMPYCPAVVTRMMSVRAATARARWSASAVRRGSRAAPRVCSGRAGSVTARDLMAVRNSGYWLVVLSGFLKRAPYLFAIGIGVGALVGDFHLADGRTVSYAVFVAPAMLAVSSMNGAIAEATFNFFAKLKWAKLYDAMVATPLRPFDIALGELTWSLMRGALYSVAFLVMMVVLDLTTAARAVPALFASLLVGLAFGALGMAGVHVLRRLVIVLHALVLIPGRAPPLPHHSGAALARRP